MPRSRQLSLLNVKAEVPATTPLWQGHAYEFGVVKNVDQLRCRSGQHEFKSAQKEEVAASLREHFYWQKSRKPEAGQR
ncbi:DUF2554 family protein [Escherichia coli]|nr:DUF2554 family protein [Escherichia coli]